MNTQAAMAMSKARTHLILDQPFFGTLAMRLELIEDTNIPTLRVNGKKVWYNPSFVNKLLSEHVVTAVAHEVMHCVLNHCGTTTRGRKLDPGRWNRACDYVINLMLVDAGFKPIQGWLYDVKYRGMSAEHIYGLLDDTGGSALDEVVESEHIEDPTAMAQERVEWVLAASQAANAAKQAGRLPKALEQFVDEMKEPKVDWRAVTRDFVQRVARGDYSWSRPNRKMLGHGFYLPGLYSEEIGNIAIAADESGSIDKAVVSAFSAEISGIKEDVRPSMTTLIHFDSEVGKVEEFGPDDPFVMKRYCHGGTDFRPIFKHIEKMPEPPTCLVVLTDLEGPFPKHAPEYPVLWVTINKHKAPFGETLRIEV